MKMSKIFFGLLVIGAGILLLFSALGIGAEYDAVRIIGSLLLLAVAIASITRFHFVLFFIPLALIVYLWRLPIGMPDLNIWLLLGAAALLGIGLSVIVHKKHKFEMHPKKRDDIGRTEETLNENELVSIDASWGEHIKYVHASNLKKAQIKSSFASTKVYFDQSQISPDGLEIHVNVSFSELVLNVPQSWVIDNRISVFAGDVANVAPNREGKPVNVTLTGDVNLAEVRVIYV
jgi:hypothetical protein